MKHLSNLITISRIAVSVIMLTVETFSAPFFLIDAYCRISYMIDGVIAGRINTISRAGAMLDSEADLILFYCHLCGENSFSNRSEIEHGMAYAYP